MMIALAARERTGRGQVVDSNLMNAAITSHLQEGTTYLNTGQKYPLPSKGIAHAHNTALYGYYQAGDGGWLTLIGEFYIDKPWQRCARAGGLAPEHIDDPRFATLDGLRTHTEETHQLLAAAIATFPRDEIMARFEAEDVLVAPVQDYDAVFSDPQVQHNGLVIEADIDGVGPVKFVGMPVQLSDTPGRLRIVPPKVGQHNDEVLTAAGYRPEQIAELKSAGVLGNEADRERTGEPPCWS
jgi:crotonobetainyl-CoA:carnitine CoA-transferase CaiB-like acyl-CoA transferase